jgi:hypothetical protein
MQANILTIQSGAIHHESSCPGISAARAVAKANGYLSKYVGLLFGAETPVFLRLDRPVWQVLVTFKMNDIGPFTAGLLDVNAITGEILPLSKEQILMIQERTDAYLKNRTLSPATAG